MIRFIVPGEPLVKERARAGRGRWYTPQQTELGEKAVRERAALALRDEPGMGFNRYPMVGPIWIGCAFYLGNVRTKKGRLHARDADLDNLLKLVMDGLTGVVWLNDKQVRGYLPGTKKVLGYKFPQTIIVIAHDDELTAEQRAAWGELPHPGVPPGRCIP